MNERTSPDVEQQHAARREILQIVLSIVSGGGLIVVGEAMLKLLVLPAPPASSHGARVLALTQAATHVASEGILLAMTIIGVTATLITVLRPIGTSWLYGYVFVRDSGLFWIIAIGTAIVWFWGK